MDRAQQVRPYLGQSLAAKVAEVRFRRDLCRYRVCGEPLFDDELGTETLVEIFRCRIAAAIADVSALPEASNITNGLEVGAECCQRAAAIAARFNIPCYAADISLDSLLSLEFYAPRLGLAALPRRVCCDLGLLPFRSGAFDLVFSYQTLHHFQRPAFVTQQIRRVNRLVFLGCDEPIRPRLRLPAGTQRHTMYSATQLAKGRWRRLCEDAFLRRRCNELEYGVIENEELSLVSWRQCLEPWYDCEWYRGAGVAGGKRIRTGWRDALESAFASLVGCSVSFVGRVRGHEDPRSRTAGDLICPDCLERDASEEELLDVHSALRCPRCATTFPVVNGIPILLPSALRRILYRTLDGVSARH